MERDKAASHFAEKAQASYYERTAERYDAEHVSDYDEHGTALRLVLAYCDLLGVQTMLDTGCGTGRAAAFLSRHRPGMTIIANDVSQALLNQALQKKISRTLFVRSSAFELPCKDAGVDAVCAFGLLHHIEEPDLAIAEMMRVARKAIFISDSNRFGQGSLSLRLIKYGLYKIGLWGVANFIKTRGLGYSISEGDGIAYSYSVIDSYPLLHRWAKTVVLIPTRHETHGSWYPALTAGHLLACAIKECPGG